MSNRDFFASIDIGSSKIIMLLAEIEQYKIHVFACESGESLGVKNGVINNLELATKSVQAVIDNIKKNYKERAKYVNINISDLQITSVNQNQPISFDEKSKILKKEDILKAIQNASAGIISADKKRLNPLVNHFTVDGQITQHPLGLEAHVLGAQVHLVSVSNQALNGVSNCLKDCDLGVDQMVLDSIASSTVCISQEQKNQGVCLLDIGASISNISVFSKGGAVYSCAFKFGGDTVTENIAQAYNTSFKEAERLKIRYGVLQPKSSLKEYLIEFEQINSNEKYYLSSHELILIIEKTYKEICTLLKKSLKTEKLDRILKAGLVVIGGASKIENCELFLLKEFRLRTQLAKINRELITGDESYLTDVSYFSALGLLTYNTNEVYLQETKPAKKSRFGKMKGLLEL